VTPIAGRSKPTRTATAEPTETPKPTKTPKPRPTKTPRPKATKTPRPVATASYNPRAIARDLLYEEIRYSEDAAFGYGSTAEVAPQDRAISATIGQTGEFGMILYLVFDTDQEALAYVLDRQSGYDWRLPDYPDHVTAASEANGSSLFLVAVGNVVVAGATDYTRLGDSYIWDGTTDPEIMAAALANYGVMRVERLGGQPDGGSSGNTW